MGNRWSVLCYILACVLLGSPIGVHVAAESESPMQLVQRLVPAITRIKPSKNGILSAADQAANAASAKEANAILDIPAVAQRTLGKHWQARPPLSNKNLSRCSNSYLPRWRIPNRQSFSTVWK